MSKLSNHQLIERLTADMQPRTVYHAWRKALPALGIVVALVFLVVWQGMGLRTAWPMTAYAKVSLFGSLAFLLWSQLIQNATPVQNSVGVTWIFYGISLASLAVLALNPQPMSVSDVFTFNGYPQCVSCIVIGGLIMWTALRRAFDSARPALDARLFGAALGAASGMAVAGLYATHCPVDAASYLAIAYLPPILLLALIGGLFPHPAWRW